MIISHRLRFRRRIFCRFAAGLVFFAATQAPASPTRAQEAAFTQALASDRAYVAELIAGIPNYTPKSPIEKVRALRAEVFRRTTLAATDAYLVNDEVLRLPLDDVYKKFEADDRGVWCAGAALLLSRVYKAAGYDAWIYNFGRAGILTHATTLVRVDGKIYLQDGYLNFEYVDDRGRPVPFADVIRQVHAVAPPRVNAPVEIKRALFLDETNAVTWVGMKHAGELRCTKGAASLKCNAPISLDHFVKTYYLMPQTYDFLEIQGWPRKLDYLLLYPMDVTAPFEGDQVEAREIYERVARFSQRGPVLPQKGWRPIDLVISSRIPKHRVVDVAPVEVATPTGAYNHGAVSAPIVVTKPSVLKLIVAVSEGRAGIALMAKDGTLLSKETPVSADAGRTELLFHVDPKHEQASLLIRNYGDEGRSAKVTIAATEISAEADLTPELLNSIPTAEHPRPNSPR